jgi:hypothetical protein
MRPMRLGYLQALRAVMETGSVRELSLFWLAQDEN